MSDETHIPLAYRDSEEGEEEEEDEEEAVAPTVCYFLQQKPNQRPISRGSSPASCQASLASIPSPEAGDVVGSSVECNISTRRVFASMGYPHNFALAPIGAQNTAVHASFRGSIREHFRDVTAPHVPPCRFRMPEDLRRCGAFDDGCGGHGVHRLGDRPGAGQGRKRSR